MENRELLSYILGYLFEVEKLKKIPSKKILLIREFIEKYEKQNKKELSSSNKNENYREDDDSNLMEGFDYDNDYDQQDPNFW